MTKLLTNWRYYVLILVSGISVVGLFSVPSDDASISEFFLYMVMTKVVGFVALLAGVMLFNYWESGDEIPELTQLTKED